MFYLVVYDIKNENGGERRLQKVAQICEHYGTRVQASVFEVVVNDSVKKKMVAELTNVIDQTLDSVRLYKLGKNKETSVEIIGRREKAEMILNDTVII